MKSPDAPQAGEILAGKYRVERFIAEGGMGVVLEATHLQLEERVAIKLLRGATQSSPNGGEAVTRFLREARAAIKIRSEHVVRVYDVGSLDSGAPYIVMEFLEGQDLEQLLEARGPLPFLEAVDHVLQACDALAEAHTLGIVHRDLKPANLFLTHSASGVPVVKVLDFGISKLSGGPAESMSMTSTQAVMGSPLYMSPEQMRATKDADARSDIWAVGVILYELLCGRPPFIGETMTQVCASIIQDTPPSIGSVRHDVPPELETVIFRCLEKKPADRVATVAELAALLVPFSSPSGQESARRIARSASFAAGRASTTSERDVVAAAMAGASNAPAPPGASATGSGKGARSASPVSATVSSWGNEQPKAKRSPTALLVGGGAAALLLVGGAFMLLRGAPRGAVAQDSVAARAAPPASTQPAAPATVAPTPAPVPSVAEPSSTAQAAATATTPAPLAASAGKPMPSPESARPIRPKRPASGAAPAAPQTPQKASWDDRK